MKKKLNIHTFLGRKIKLQMKIESGNHKNKIDFNLVASEF